MSQKPPDLMPWGFVGSLATAQIVSWGSLIYAFTLFIAPMGQELGWTKPQLTLAYSLGLCASGLAAVTVGSLIDRGHGRLVMTGGSLAATLLLLAWARVESYPAFLAIWVAIGATMSAVLYDPGFAVLTRRLGPLSRRGITAMTLIGGFASTVFIPLTHLFIQELGWRGALLALSALNGLVVLVHALVVPAGASDLGIKTSHPDAPSAGTARRVLRLRPFWGFVVTSVLHGAVFTGFAVHMIPLLVERGLSLDAAVGAFSLVGPAQVAARFLIATTERRIGMRAIGLATTALAGVAFMLLWFVGPGSWLVVPFVLLYGASNGMMTIVRAVLPAELFGQADYGAIQGMISAPATLAKAAAPFAFGALWAVAGGYDAVLAVAVALSVATFVSFALLVAMPSASRQGSHGGGGGGSTSR
jgi:predicted MFS family arabinose efflux permease